MIKKFNDFVKESLLGKLEGPTKEEVWKNFGYDEPLETVEEYFSDIFDKFIYANNLVNKKWYDKEGYDSDLCIVYNIYPKKLVTCFLDEYFKKINNLFGLTSFQARPIVGKVIREKLNLDKKVTVSFLTDEGEYDAEN